MAKGLQEDLDLTLLLKEYSFSAYISILIHIPAAELNCCDSMKFEVNKVCMKDVLT